MNIAANYGGRWDIVEAAKEVAARHARGELELDAIVKQLKDVGFKRTLTNDIFNYPLLEDGARRNADRIRAVEAELGIQA